jgi:hypothetical protein
MKSNIKFHENPFSGTGADICGQLGEQLDGRKDMMQVTGAFYDCMKARNKFKPPIA